MGSLGRWGQLGRRDFLVGAAGGIAASGAAWVAAPMSWHESRLPPGVNLSFAQNGEDLVVESLFRVLGIERPTYLDIGAYEPVLCNNTYFFYRKGGHGVLVEPNVDLTPMLKKERPRDVVLTAGVGIDDTPEADYYVTSFPQLNTFDKSEADLVGERTRGQAKVLRVVKMPLININRILAEHLGTAPDYLSIDVEGVDVAILKTLDVNRYRPAIVCTEHPRDPAQRAVLLELMAGYGYAVRGLTFPNTVFVDLKRMP